MSSDKKYIFVNGVMKLNPAYGNGAPIAPQTSLAVVSSMSVRLDISLY